MTSPDRPKPPPLPPSPAAATHRAPTPHLPAPSESPAVETFLWLAMLAGWSGLALVVIAALAVLLYFAVPVLGVATPFAMILLLVLAAGLFKALRRRRAYAAIAYLEQAARLNLPLPAMLRAAERSEGVGTARAMRRLRVELECGRSVHESLGIALPGLAPRTLGLVGAAERSGRLPQALARLSRESITRFSGSRPQNEFYLRWYPPTLVLVSAMVLGGMGLFVMPKLQEIFSDFKLELPALTTRMFGVLESASLPLLALVGLLTLLISGRTLATVFTPSPLPRGPLRTIGEWIAWHVPGMAGVTRWRALADACHVLADAVEAGHSLERALSEACEARINVVLAGRLEFWRQVTLAGAAPADGAAKSEMPPLLVGLLRTTGGADLHDLFRFLGRYYDSRFARSTLLLQAAVVPALSLAMGAIVTVILLGLFLPLISLIDRINGLVWRFGWHG
jgi:type II secretory pathway component PulF